MSSPDGLRDLCQCESGSGASLGACRNNSVVARKSCVEFDLRRSDAKSDRMSGLAARLDWLPCLDGE
mgnify:CR=1 FL=1